MHRVVLYSRPVKSDGVVVYGKLCSGYSESIILHDARTDYYRLLVKEQWDGDAGDQFRQRENWRRCSHDDDEFYSWWEYDKNYTYLNGVGFQIPDQFMETIHLPIAQVAIAPTCKLLRLDDCNIDDHIINQSYYDSVLSAADEIEIEWE